MTFNSDHLPQLAECKQRGMGHTLVRSLIVKIRAVLVSTIQSLLTLVKSVTSLVKVLEIYCQRKQYMDFYVNFAK